MASSPPPTAGNRRDSSSDNKNSSNVNHDGNGNADSNALKPTGAQLAARALKELGVTVIFGLVGIPVIEVAEEAINLGIRFIACRNEQTCGYAASAYGYMTHRPGVCLVVGGPGVLHAMAGIGNANANGFPLLLLAGSAETSLVNKGAFQELDAISLLTPHTKLATRPSSFEKLGFDIRNAYRLAYFGRPGPTFVDLPADIIQGTARSFPEEGKDALERLRGAVSSSPSSPKPAGDPATINAVAKLLFQAQAPLIVLGKGAAYSRAEVAIRAFVSQAGIPFLPTPMGKGVVADSHPSNAASARSAALKHADVVLVLGARLNWILHYGEAPKWSPAATLVQVDICPEEIGRNAGSIEYGIVGDIALVVQQLLGVMKSWRWSARPLNPPLPAPMSQSSTYPDVIARQRAKNEATVEAKACLPTESGAPMTYHRVFHIIKKTLDSLSPPENGDIIYVSEGANTMDISRTIFSVEHPRHRLDAGTFATMGVGLGYIIGAYAARTLSSSPAARARAAVAAKAANAATAEAAAAAETTAEDAPRSYRPKKIVAFEGDSAFGFSGMDVETLARYRIPALIFVINNNGIYHADAATRDDWERLQVEDMKETGALRSTGLLWETRYEKLAEMVGGKGHFVRTEQELREATAQGYEERDRVTVVNVMVEPGSGKKVKFAWQGGADSKL